MQKATAAQFKCVKIFLTDVDGVLTNATVFMNGSNEYKQFNVQDGMGLRLLQHIGIPVGWVSNRKSDATTARAKELKVDYLLIPDEYMLLKQNVSFKFQNLDYKEAMSLMAKIGDVNILVGEEVAGAISAELSSILPLIGTP